MILPSTLLMLHASGADHFYGRQGENPQIENKTLPLKVFNVQRHLIGYSQFIPAIYLGPAGKSRQK